MWLTTQYAKIKKLIQLLTLEVAQEMIALLQGMKPEKPESHWNPDFTETIYQKSGKTPKIGVSTM